jgi:hypothetical protein
MGAAPLSQMPSGHNQTFQQSKYITNEISGIRGVINLKTSTLVFFFFDIGPLGFI